MPWALSSSLGDDKLIFGPKHNIYTFVRILFGLFDLILLFVCQIYHVYCETENWKYTKFIFNKSIFYALTNERMFCSVVVPRQAPDERLVLRAVRVFLDPLDLPFAELAVLRTWWILRALGVTRHEWTKKSI